MNLTLEILQLGFVGLGFLLAGLAYRLLREEIVRQGRERPEMLKTIRYYMVFALALGCIAAALEFLKMPRPLGAEWTRAGTGDFTDMDTGLATNADKPDDQRCTKETLGLTAICWPELRAKGENRPCRYKTVLAQAITPRTGTLPGDVYSCVPKR